MSSPAHRAFTDRLLELVPIYYEAGREIAALQPSLAAPSALTLAGVAARRWLLGALPSNARALRPVVSQLEQTADRPQALIDFARDVARLSAVLGDQRLAATARHAEDVARAAAAGDQRAAGRAAADCLFSRRADGQRLYRRRSARGHRRHRAIAPRGRCERFPGAPQRRTAVAAVATPAQDSDP